MRALRHGHNYDTGTETWWSHTAGPRTEGPGNGGVYSRIAIHGLNRKCSHLHTPTNHCVRAHSHQRDVCRATSSEPIGTLSRLFELPPFVGARSCDETESRAGGGKGRGKDRARGGARGGGRATAASAAASSAAVGAASTASPLGAASAAPATVTAATAAEAARTSAPASSAAQPDGEDSLEASPTSTAAPPARITVAQATAMREWFRSYFTSGYPLRLNAKDPAIAAKIAELGITAAKASRQLGLLRDGRDNSGTAGTRPRTTAEEVTARRKKYREQLVAAVDEVQIFREAAARLSESPFVERLDRKKHPYLDLLFAPEYESFDVVRVVRGLLHSWCGASAEAWSTGKAGTPLLFETHRWSVALPKFLCDFEVAVLAELDCWDVMYETSYSLRSLGAWLEDELYAGYSAALDPGVKPPIVEPPGGTAPKFSDGERATIYYIAGYLLRIVNTRLAERNEQQSNATREWCRILVECCSVSLTLAREERLPLDKVESRSRGGLVYANSGFFTFVLALEHVFVHNMTPSHVEAYPTTLMTKIRKMLVKSQKPRRVLENTVIPCLPLEAQQLSVPESFYGTVFEVYGRMRSKDFALTLHRSYDRERASDASAANVTHRALMAANAASGVRRKRAERAAAQSLPASKTPTYPKIGTFLVGRHVMVLFDVSPPSDDEGDSENESDGGEGRQEWSSGTINKVDLAFAIKESGKSPREGKVAHVTPDIDEEDWWFELRDKPYWHGSIAGAWKLV